MYKCFYCEHELTWGGDENAEDATGDDSYKGRIWSNLSCPNCGAEYEVITPKKEYYATEEDKTV